MHRDVDFLVKDMEAIIEADKPSVKFIFYFIIFRQWEFLMHKYYLYLEEVKK